MIDYRFIQIPKIEAKKHFKNDSEKQKIKSQKKTLKNTIHHTQRLLPFYYHGWIIKGVICRGGYIEGVYIRGVFPSIALCCRIQLIAWKGWYSSTLLCTVNCATLLYTVYYCYIVLYSVYLSFLRKQVSLYLRQERDLLINFTFVNQIIHFSAYN